MGKEFNPDLSVVASDFLDMPVLTLLAEEGPIDVASRRAAASGARNTSHLPALEIQPGDPVVVDPSQDYAVLRRVPGAGAQTIVGFATGYSRALEGVEMKELLEIGTWADPDMFQITIETLASFLRTVTLDGVAAVVPGDGVKLSATGVATFTKGTANNGTLVIVGGLAGEECSVLMGHVGVYS